MSTGFSVGRWQKQKIRGWQIWSNGVLYTGWLQSLSTWRSRVAGRARTIGNRVYPKRVSRVQIPPSPPKKQHPFLMGVVFLFYRDLNNSNATRMSVAREDLPSETLIFAIGENANKSLLLRQKKATPFGVVFSFGKVREVGFENHKCNMPVAYCWNQCKHWFLL